MKFTVLGVDSQTGQEMRLQLEAPTAREAYAIAHQKGIMVSKVVTMAEKAAAERPTAQKPTAAKPLQPAQQPTAKGPAISHFSTKVAGVTFRNFDATDRQDIIRNCRVPDSIILRREQAKGTQEPAVNVFTANDEQIGRLGPEPSGKVSALMNEGYRVFAFISKLSGGNILNKVREVELVIVYARPGTLTALVQQYVNGLRP